MIECLKKVLYRYVFNKIIIVVIYSFYFIDIYIIIKMYVFFRKKVDEFYVCFVRNVGYSKEFLRVFDIEMLRILLFVIKVLLVEGVIDREVV